MKTAVYPGRFDPITNGHIDVIKRGLKIFDKLVIAVVKDSRKDCIFSVKEREEMIKEVTKDLNVGAESFSGLLVDYLKKKSTKFILRGMREISDFEREFQMAIANKKLDPEIETVFVMTDKEYFYLNSSLVRELARLGGPLKDFVPKNVEDRLRNRFKK